MSYKVIVRDKARADSLAAYRHYKRILPSLGIRFFEELQSCYTKLATNPEYYGIVAEDRKHVFRDIKIKGFPYVVFFEIVAKNVIVFAVHNTYQDLPDRYTNRTE